MELFTFRFHEAFRDGISPSQALTSLPVLSALRAQCPRRSQKRKPKPVFQSLQFPIFAGSASTSRPRAFSPSRSPASKPRMQKPTKLGWLNHKVSLLRAHLATLGL